MRQNRDQPVRVGDGTGTAIGVVPAQRGGLVERIAHRNEVVEPSPIIRSSIGLTFFHCY